VRVRTRKRALLWVRRRATERAPSSRHARRPNSMNDGLWPVACAVFNSRRLHRKPQRRLGFSSFVHVGRSGSSLSSGIFLQGIERFSTRVLPSAARDDLKVSRYASGVMSSAAVRQVIALAAELSEEERRVVIDAIAPQESVAGLAAEWEAEIARRAELVRTGQSVGKPATEVFDRLEARLKAR
jgi:hypothetical protein